MLTLTRFAAAFAVALAYLLAAPHLPALPGHDLNAFVSGAVGLLLCAGIVIAALPLRDDLRAILAGLVVGGAGGRRAVGGGRTRGRVARSRRCSRPRPGTGWRASSSLR